MKNYIINNRKKNLLNISKLLFNIVTIKKYSMA